MPAFDGVTTPSVSVQFLKSGTWTAVTTSDLIQIDIRRGRVNQSDFDSSGVSVVIFNNTSGYYDPDNLSVGNPWVVGGVNILRDGLQMRIIATISGVAYPLYNGFLEETKVNQGVVPSTAMTFVDGIAYIADAQAPALATAGFAETAALRVGRMLDYAGWTGSRSWAMIMVPLTLSTIGRT
jgi:hypothetical protein